MSDYLQRFDSVINNVSKGLLTLSNSVGDSLADMVKAMTTDKDLYEDAVVYEFAGRNSKYGKLHLKLIKNGNRDKANEIARMYAKKLSPTETKNFTAAMLLEHQGFNAMAQNICDGIYANRLRGELNSRMEQMILSEAFKEKQKNIAQRPRNPHHDDALRIAKATWEKYPGASKERLCKKLRDHFNGRVSVDSLNSWIKKANIQPPKPRVYTSFSLVI